MAKGRKNGFQILKGKEKKNNNNILQLKWLDFARFRGKLLFNFIVF